MWHSVILVLVGHFDCKHRCHVEKIVTIAFILSSRWQDGESSIRMESNNLTEKLAPFVRQNYFSIYSNSLSYSLSNLSASKMKLIFKDSWLEGSRRREIWNWIIFENWHLATEFNYQILSNAFLEFSSSSEEERTRCDRFAIFKILWNSLDLLLGHIWNLFTLTKQKLWRQGTAPVWTDIYIISSPFDWGDWIAECNHTRLWSCDCYAMPWAVS